MGIKRNAQRGKRTTKRGLKDVPLRTLGPDKARGVRGGQSNPKKGGGGGGGGGKLL